MTTASVVGRTFRPETVAAADQANPDEVAADLEIAIAAGLLVPHGDDAYAFTHALVRDAVYSSIPPRRRARVHAQIAHAFATDDGLRRLYSADELTAELARHWLASGPTYAEQAWRAADAAATQARGAAAYRAAMGLRSAAVAAHQRTPGAAVVDRYDLLIELARDAAYAAVWPSVVDAAFEAMSLGRNLGSPERVGRAASMLTLYCVWMPHRWLEVHEDAIDDLRWGLRTLPDSDSPARCMLLLSLAAELCYEPSATAERLALVDAGIAAARRIGDHHLLWWATRAAWISSWTYSRTTTRLPMSQEGIDAARAANDSAAEAVSLLALAIDHLELGHPDLWADLSSQAERIGRREQLPFVLYTINWVEMGLASLRGDDDETRRRRDAVLDWAAQTELPEGELVGTVIGALEVVWKLREGYALPDFVDLANVPLARAAVHGILARTGPVELLRELVADAPWAEPLETWQSVLMQCFEAEAASVLGDTGLAARAIEVLQPNAGRMALAGVSIVFGPVDGFLALAQATVGDREAALVSAQRAREAAERWGYPAYLDWLDRATGRMGLLEP